MPVRTDEECGRVMEPVLLGGKIKWICYCGNSYPGSPEDTLLAQGDLRPSAQSYTTQTYIRAAPTDRVAPRVLRDCDRCGMDTMVTVRGNRMEVIYLCPHCDAQGSGSEENKLAVAEEEKKPAAKENTPAAEEKEPIEVKKTAAAERPAASKENAPAAEEKVVAAKKKTNPRPKPATKKKPNPNQKATTKQKKKQK